MQLTFLKKKKNVKRIAVIAFTIILFLLVSFLVIYQTGFYQGKMWTYLGESDDRFHMMRIEGLYHSIQRRQFFPFINMSMMDGFGYIVNIFYSDFLIYPAAFLRLIGFTSAKTLLAYYLMMNFFTFGVSFLCFYKVSKKYFNSLVFSFVYTLSTYRLHDLLFRHDFGELGAFIFLPIAVLGIYEVFYGNRKKWLYLTFGMTAIIYSHAIMPVLLAILILMVMLFRVKELKAEPKRLLSLLWAALTSLMLSLAYFMPIFEQLHHTKFFLTENKGILPAGASSLSDVTRWSLDNTVGQPNIGLTLLLAVVVILISFTKIKNDAVRQFSIIGVILLICSTKVFPWILLNNTPLKMLQYPWRIDMIVTILLAIFVASDPLNFFSTKTAKSLLVALVFLFSISASYRLVNGSPLQRVEYSEYNKLNTFAIGAGEEYLPEHTILSNLERTPHKPAIANGKTKAKLSNFKQYGTRLSVDFKGADHDTVVLPILAYYGFQSTQSTGRVSKVTMNKNNNNFAQVTVSGKGKIVVDYFETTIQKASRRISFLSLLVIIAVIFINKLNLVDFSKIEGFRSSGKDKPKK